MQLGLLAACCYESVAGVFEDEGREGIGGEGEVGELARGLQRERSVVNYREGWWWTHGMWEQEVVLY